MAVKIGWLKRVGLFLVALAALGCQESPPVSEPTPGVTSSPRPVLVNPASKYIVAAHYYTWFEEAFQNGYLRGKLRPPQIPELGLYSNHDPAVVEKHIAWASEYGIDVLTLDFWPTQSKGNRRHDVFMNASNIGDIQFCIFYESGDLGYDPKLDATHFDSDTSAALISDLEWIADKYFDHPQYFRIAGRPVLILYVTRTFTGEYDRAIREARRRLKAKGHDVFLIGDEVYWACQAAGAQKPSGRGNASEAPQQSRIRLFDAITAYNFYNPDQAGHAGYAAGSNFLRDVAALTQRYIDATEGAVPVLPSVMPGYNDRAYRPRQEHFPIPRVWAKGEPEGSFLAHMIDDFALPFTDPRIPLMFVTSWNEWNEDTAIEPARVSASTNRDSNGEQFTQGYSYSGYGTTYLQTIRDRTIAISGLVKDKEGRVLVDQMVSAWRGDSLVATDLTDSQGRFHLSRMTVSPGTYSVGLSRAAARSVRVSTQRTTTGVHLEDSGQSGVTRLSLDLGQDQSRRYLVEGFSFDEIDGSTTYAWSLGPVSRLALPLGSPPDEPYLLRMRLRGFRAICPVVAAVSMNGERLGTVTATPDWRTVELEVPPAALKAGENLLEIEFAKTGRPSELVNTQDRRELAVGFDRLWLAPKGP